MIEYRKPKKLPGATLPADYIKLAESVFTSNFEEGLVALKAITHKNSSFSMVGEIAADEISVGVSLITDQKLAATTIWGSADYDPLASQPNVETLLSAIIDAIGILFEALFDPKVVKNKEPYSVLLAHTTGELENIPFEWTETESNKIRVYIKLDKANAKLDQLTEEWLKQHDPEYQKQKEEALREAEELFVTPDTIKKKGTLH